MSNRITVRRIQEQYKICLKNILFDTQKETDQEKRLILLSQALYALEIGHMSDIMTLDEYKEWLKIYF